MLSDINLHFDSTLTEVVRSPRSFFPTIQLAQHISVPTHCRGYTLDWLIAVSIRDIEVVDKLLSDNNFCHVFQFNLRMPDVSSRTMRKIDLNAFNADVGALQFDSSYPHSYRDVLDKHASLRHCRTTDCPSSPWVILQIKEAKQQRRCAERRWRKSGLTVQRQIITHHREKAKELFLQAK